MAPIVSTPNRNDSRCFYEGSVSAACIPVGMCVPATGDIEVEGIPIARLGDDLEIPGDDSCTISFVCPDVFANDRGVARKIDYGVGRKKGKAIGPRDTAPSVLLANNGQSSAVSPHDEYEQTIALLEESLVAAKGQPDVEKAAHDYIQNIRRDENLPASVRDRPAIVNAHRYWKGVGLRKQYGWLPSVGAAEFDFWAKLTGLDKWLYRKDPPYGGFGTNLPPSPFRPSATLWFYAGIYAKPGRWPSRSDVDPNAPPLIPDSRLLDLMKCDGPCSA